MGDSHKTYTVDNNSSYLGHTDPVTRTPFKTGDIIVVCSKTGAAIALRSVSASENRCPFCGKPVGNETTGVLSPLLTPRDQKDSFKAKISSKRSPYPENRRERQFSGTWVGLLAIFCLLVSVGTIVVVRSLQTVPSPESPNTSAEPNPTDPIREISTTEVPISIPTRISTSESDQDGWIVFAFGQDQVGGSGSNTGRDLYLLNRNTNKKRQLTSGNSGNNFPSFSPDGEKIVYTGCRPDCKLYVLEIDSGNEMQLPGITVKAMAPSWCSAKPWVVFEARQNNNKQISLEMIDLSDNKITTLTKGPADSRPVWSPDCSKILFGRATADTNRDGYISTNDRLDMYIYDLFDKSTNIVLETPEADEFGFTWSPNDSLIAFTRVSKDTDNNGQITLDDQSELFLYDLNTKQETNLTKGSYSAFSPSFSFDGSFIVFTSYEGYGSRIVVYSIFDATFVAETEVGNYYHASWKP